MLTAHYYLAQAAQFLAAPGGDPTTAPTAPAGSTIINTTGILDFFMRVVAPVLLGVLGLVFLGRANRGRVSQVVTSSGITFVAFIFLAGAATLPFLGGAILNLIIGK